MKKFSSILLLVAMLLFTTGSYLVFKKNTSTIKSQMKRAIAHHQFGSASIEKISIALVNNRPQAAGFKIEDDHEISLCGKMYDIVSSEILGDSITYHCISDEKETKLLANYAALFLHPSSSKKNTTLIKFSFSDYTFCSAPRPVFFMEASILNFWYSNHTCRASHCINIPSPPPRLGVS